MGPSFWQILIVLVIVLFLFGPKRIPGLGKSLGEAIRGFRKGISGDDNKEDLPSSGNGNDNNKSDSGDKSHSENKPPSSSD